MLTIPPSRNPRFAHITPFAPRKQPTLRARQETTSEKRSGTDAAIRDVKPGSSWQGRLLGYAYIHHSPKTALQLSTMPDSPIIMTLDKPHFQVKLHHDRLQVDLKEGVRAELEKLAEARPILRDSLGWIFQTIIPLDVKLWEIEKVQADSTGKMSIKIPHRRDLHIPLEPAESRQLTEKLEQLIPLEKEREFQRQKSYEAAMKQREASEAEALRLTRRPA